MSPTELEADALVHTYLNGRTLPSILHSAVVWVVEKRLSSGKLPVLDATLMADIDSQAITPATSVAVPTDTFEEESPRSHPGPRTRPALP